MQNRQQLRELGDLHQRKVQQQPQHVEQIIPLSRHVTLMIEYVM